MTRYEVRWQGASSTSDVLLETCATLLEAHEIMVDSFGAEDESPPELKPGESVSIFAVSGWASIHCVDNQEAK